MQLDYHSFYEQPAPAPAPPFVWMPPTKRPQKQVVVGTMNAELPAAAAVGTATVRNTGTLDTTLPMQLLVLAAMASYRLPGRASVTTPIEDDADAMLLALGAILLLDDDDDD